MSNPERVIINLEMYEGARYQAGFIWESGDDEASMVAVDLTGWTGRLEVRDTIESPTVKCLMTTENGLLIFTDQTEIPGGYDIDLPGEDSQGWCLGHKEVRAVYDLFIYDPDGNPRAHQAGEWKIQPAVTRPWEATP